MSLPRMARISRSESCSRSLPWKRTEPAILPGGSGISRISDIEVTDLPHPDSPPIALVDLEGHAIDRAVNAVGRAEMGLQILDFEQRHRIRTSTALQTLYRLLA